VGIVGDDGVVVTLLLNATAIDSLLDDLDAAVEAVRAGFLADQELQAWPPLRTRTALPGPGTATALLPGLLPGVPAYTAKINAKFPAARPALRGVVCLHALDDGSLLALLDSATVTAWRTGIAAALLTDRLADPTAGTLGIVGAGAQARIAMRTLARLRALEAVAVHDVDLSAARRLCALANEMDIEAVMMKSPALVAQRASIVVLATWSRGPLLARDQVRDGHHLTSLGADEPGKYELGADVLTESLLVVDDRDLVQRSGATASAGLGPDRIDATASEVLRGEHPGRSSRQQLTVYAPIGLPWQDLAISWRLFQAARDTERGVHLDLLS
jgi:ornithine cyclodeaminase